MKHTSERTVLCACVIQRTHECDTPLDICTMHGGQVYAAGGDAFISSIKDPGPYDMYSARQDRRTESVCGSMLTVRARGRKCAERLIMYVLRYAMTQRDPPTGMIDGQFCRRIPWTAGRFLLQSCYVRRKKSISEHRLCAGTPSVVDSHTLACACAGGFTWFACAREQPL